MLTAVAMLWQLRRLRVGPGGCGARALAWHGSHAGGHSSSFVVNYRPLAVLIRCTIPTRVRVRTTPSALQQRPLLPTIGSGRGFRLFRRRFRLAWNSTWPSRTAAWRIASLHASTAHPGSSRKHSHHKESTKRTGGRVALSLETAAETSHAFAALVVQLTSAATPTNLHGRKCHAAQCMCPDAGAMGRLDSREGAGGDACITV